LFLVFIHSLSCNNLNYLSLYSDSSSYGVSGLFLSRINLHRISTISSEFL
jgi:hypothetical protein